MADLQNGGALYRLLMLSRKLPDATVILAGSLDTSADGGGGREVCLLRARPLGCSLPRLVKVIIRDHSDLLEHENNYHIVRYAAKNVA